MKHLWHVDVLTLFPEMFPGFLGHSLSGKALEAGIWSYNAVNIRDFATDKHKTVDDTPFGGGAGMVLRADVIERAVISLQELPSPNPLPKGRGPSSFSLQGEGALPHGKADEGSIYAPRKLYLSPRGKPLTQAMVQELAALPRLMLLCGRYEGVDQRALDACGFEEISIGDYVLSGGEQAAMILMDACIRLLPGVMGNAETAAEESFSGGLLEYPHYTRPAQWVDSNGISRDVPEVLKSGDHAKIAAWRREEAEKLTRERRPDLFL